MVHCTGISDKVIRSRWIFLFHIPILGGWRNYTVLEPEKPGRDWYIGYKTNDIIGISRIILTGRVRMLIGHGNVSFYGIDAECYEQIAIREIDRGRIGEGGKFAKEKLL